MTTTILAQIAPQRSTQYAALANDLALPEILLSSLGENLRAVDAVSLGGQDYLSLDFEAPLSKTQRYELGTLAMTNVFFDYHPEIGGVEGPFLRPIDTGFSPALPPDMAYTRRYRGKTNEMFTHFLCNVAKFSSRLADQPWSELRLFDPLMGGGTTLFTGLMLGAHVAGVEQSDQNVKSTAAFMRQYLQSARLSYNEQTSRLRKLGLRWDFSIGKKNGQDCVLALGDTTDSNRLAGGFKPHLIVADLPYGVQHRQEVEILLTEALPVWASMLNKRGAMVLAWDATRFPREEIAALVEVVGGLAVLTQPPYDTLAHRVDRVIKERDVLVAVWG